MNDKNKTQGADIQKWQSIYKERPTDGAVCASRLASNSEGYTSNTTYDARSATFRSFIDRKNRLIITIWKHDEWRYENQDS